MKPIKLILTPAEYFVIKEAISRFEKATLNCKTVQSLICNRVCSEILSAIEEVEQEGLAEDTEE